LIPSKYHGLDRFEARKLIVADLEAAGLLVEIKPHKLQVPRGDRSGQVIEPFLTDQWFVKMDDLAKRGLELVESGEVKFVPPNWINTYRHWLENIQDWTISRQLWWGHRIPAWFDETGKIYVGRSEAEVRATHGLGDIALRQDPDVLETWFSSAMFPFSTQGWPDEDAMGELGFDIALPTSVLVTGFDIIFFWVARMIMMTDRLVGRVPFRDVYITGLVRDKDGQKMSKSKGNILDPLDIIDGISADALVAKRTTGLMQPKMAEKIEKATRREFPNGINAHGADALRFTMAALAGPGRDIKFDLQRAEGYKNFCNKLWNATRFALMNLPDSLPPQAGGDARRAEGGKLSPVTDAEKWILAQLDRTTAEAAEHFASYRFDLLAQCLYEFTWNQVCDWFLELAKPALNGGDAAAADSTRHTLLFVLDALLRLLHPLIPFVTEELWQAVAPKLGKSGSIMLQPYPQSGDIDAAAYAQADADIEWLKAMVSAVRRIRSELGVSPARQLALLLRGGNADDASRIARFDAPLRFLCRLERIETIAGEPPAAAPAVVGELQLFVPLEGLVDLDAERARLDKEIAKVAAEKDRSEAKLAKFGPGVPAPVVEQERARLADWSSKLDALAAQRARLS
jgi:valyl-tRNA synthetase